ncbi:MAG: acyl-CoA dehydrogenase family protein [Bacteroidales bacterium]|nr:acyl-CoA dehydrogenase family protein [Bacteroidales bacterium]
MEKELNIKGCEFLTKSTDANEIFIPEEFDEEQTMIAQTCGDFLETEVFCNLDRIDNKEQGLMRQILEKSGELGLLGISLPEEYGGFGQNFLTSMYANEVLGAGYSFSVAYSAHTGIGTLPIAYYGNEQQREKYLPGLASGEAMAAFCLTEPGAGSDANAGKTKAVLSEDETHYILNGQKMWITNGGFADVQVVFAKVGADRILSAFIVDGDSPGIEINPEEEKMGIKGSSTVQIFYNDVKVPAENLLGRRGEGFRIALYTLHMGRIKLGGNVIGAAKRAISQSVNYANERKQFGNLISNFGSIKYKLGEQVIRNFANESAVYRASKNVDEAIEAFQQDGMDYGKSHMEAFVQYEAEAALLKVYGSEMLDYVVDEMVQIMGGMGFSSEMPADRAYRDSRINRIFEGTNEINRIWVADTVVKRGHKHKIELFERAKQVMQEVEKGEAQNKPSGDYFEDKTRLVENFKKVALMLVEAASNKLGRKMSHEQEILMNLSDIVMLIYVAESSVLRVKKREDINAQGEASLYRDMLDVLMIDSADQIRKCAIDAIYSLDSEENEEKYRKGIEYFTDVKRINVKEARRRIADKLIEENRYCF